MASWSKHQRAENLAKLLSWCPWLLLLNCVNWLQHMTEAEADSKVLLSPVTYHALLSSDNWSTSHTAAEWRLFGLIRSVITIDPLETIVHVRWIDNWKMSLDDYSDASRTEFQDVSGWINACLRNTKVWIAPAWGEVVTFLQVYVAKWQQTATLQNHNWHFGSGLQVHNSTSKHQLTSIIDLQQSCCSNTRTSCNCAQSWITH